MTRPTIPDEYGDGHFGYGELLNPDTVDDLIVQHNEHAAALDALEAGGGGEALNVTNYGAVGDGVTDDATSITSAVAAAVSQNRRLHFPYGTYLINSAISVPGSVSLSGNNATIRFASTLRNAFEVAASTNKVRVDGLTFTGDTENDFNLNPGIAIYCLQSVTDITVLNCTFNYCRPLLCASDGTNGRVSFRGNRVFNAALPISSSQYSEILGNWFINDAIETTRAQSIYIFGPAEGCIIANNVFKNTSGEAIQIRAGAARYGTKRNFIIANNFFENGEGYGIWAGSDDSSIVGGFTIVGNNFKNVASMVALQGCDNSTFANNHGEWDWEYPNAAGPTNSAIVVVGGAGLTGHRNQSSSVRIFGNQLVQRHPWFGYLDFAGIPTAGDQVIVGSVTYTWVAGAPAVAGDVQIQGTVNDCIGSLAAEIMGYYLTPQNAVIRDVQDVFFNVYTTVGAINTRLVIASHANFTLSTSVGVVTATPAFNAALSCGHPLGVDAAAYPVIEGNTFVDFAAQAYVQHSISPTVANNKFTGCALYMSGNAYSVVRGNRFTRTLASDSAGLLPYRLLSCTDGFPVLENNGLICEQEYNTTELGGGSGFVNVSDGRSRMFLYYGAEQTTSPPEPHCIPYAWSDGDTVQFWDGGTTWTFTFKRDTPGALQFNDATSLIALINATGTLMADYATFYDAGSSPNPSLMIEVKTLVPGAAGDANACWVTTRSLTCGLILRNRILAEDMSWFRAGSTPTSGTGNPGDPYLGTTKTFVFTPIASTASTVTVQAADSASASLSPTTYVSDIVPGVGFTINHGATLTASEKFAFRVNTQ